MKIILLGLTLLLLTACESSSKEKTESAPEQATGSKEKKTTLGKAVQSARDVNSTSEARTRDLEKELNDVTE